MKAAYTQIMQKTNKESDINEEIIDAIKEKVRPSLEIGRKEMEKIMEKIDETDMEIEVGRIKEEIEDDEENKEVSS